MSRKEVTEATSAAAILIGNANAQISCLRREKLVTPINKNLSPLVKDDADFTEVAPNLFGADFSKRVKEHLDQVKSLRYSTCVQQDSERKPLFLQGLPLREGSSPRKRQRSLSLQGKCQREALECKTVTPPCTHTVISHSLKPSQYIQKYHFSCQNTFAGMGIVPLSLQASPAGRLAHFVANWQKVSKDRWILDTVRRYRIGFMSYPHQKRKPHPSHFNMDQQRLVALEIAELCQKRAVTEVRSTPTNGFLSTLFLVPKKDGGQRPVINLKSLNSFVEVPNFKMEGIHTLKNLLMKGDWLVKIDLKDAHFSIQIDPEHRKFLCFQALGKLYHFNCLPFGLASAPWVFTKTLRPVAALGRELGMRLVVYINNILFMAESKEKARDQASGLIYLLECLGFIINSEKTISEPFQILEFLGLTVNTVLIEPSLPPGK